MRKHWRTEPGRPGRRHPGGSGGPDDAGGADPQGAGAAGGSVRRGRRGRSLIGSSVFLTLVALALAAGPYLGDRGSPRAYVGDNYVRSPADDIGRDAVAYTSPLPPTRVAGDITDRWQPARGCADSEGVYLRYAEDTVVVLLRQEGSLILVEKSTTAYPRYLRHVAGYWDA